MIEQEKIIDRQKISDHLTRVIQFPTVSHLDETKIDWAAFEGMQAALESMYPRIHETMKIERIAGHALIYHWQGTDATGEPILFMAHQDIVSAGDESHWERPPFSGLQENGYIWGRGALDMKSQMIAFFEAAECLLATGFSPKDDIYFVLGKDEELSGITSARATSKVLQDRGLRFKYVLDENLGFWSGDEFGIDSDLAVIGLCEKGYAVLRLTAHDSGGHASQPKPWPARPALSRVAEAALKLERNPMPARIAAPCDAIMDALTPHMSQENQDLWKKRQSDEQAVLDEWTKTPKGNALFRTTFVLTQAQGSSASNVIPEQATMSFNVRIAPWDTCESVLDYAKKIIDDDSIDVDYELATSATAIADIHSEGYQCVQEAVQKFYPSALAVPGMMLAGTDSRNFSIVSDCVLRFSAAECYLRLAHTVHAANERIEIDSLENMGEFFVYLMRQA